MSLLTFKFQNSNLFIDENERMLFRFNICNSSVDRFQRTPSMWTRAKNCDVFWQKNLTLTSGFSSLKNSNNLSEEIGGFTIYLGFTYLHTNSANHFWKTPKMEVEQRQIVRRRHLHSLWQNGYHVWHSRHQFAPWLQADFPLFLSRHRLQKKMFQFDDFFGFFCKSKQSAVLSTNRVNRRVLQILIHT